MYSFAVLLPCLKKKENRRKTKTTIIIINSFSRERVDKRVPAQASPAASPTPLSSSLVLTAGITIIVLSRRARRRRGRRQRWQRWQRQRRQQQRLWLWLCDDGTGAREISVSVIIVNADNNRRLTKGIRHPYTYTCTCTRSRTKNMRRARMCLPRALLRPGTLTRTLAGLAPLITSIPARCPIGPASRIRLQRADKFHAKQSRSSGEPWQWRWRWRWERAGEGEKKGHIRERGRWNEVHAMVPWFHGSMVHGPWWCRMLWTKSDKVFCCRLTAGLAKAYCCQDFLSFVVWVCLI